MRRHDPRPNGINILEGEDYDDINMAEGAKDDDGDDEYYHDPFEVALDSGAGEHVADDKEAPAYHVSESRGSRAGQHFVAANKSRIRNRGQFTLGLRSGGRGKHAGRDIKSTFQVASVTRPLRSVGRICDEGYDVKFTKSEAVVLNPQGKVICRFERRGGLYIAKLWLRRPKLPKDADFAGRGKSA